MSCDGYGTFVGQQLSVYLTPNNIDLVVRNSTLNPLSRSLVLFQVRANFTNVEVLTNHKGVLESFGIDIKDE